MPEDVLPAEVTPRPTNRVDPRASAMGLTRSFLPAAVVIAAALYSIWMVRSAREAATPAQWEAVAQRVAHFREKGELIVFAPSWVDPLGRQYLGDQITLAMAARMDSARYSGIWEVSAYGEHALETRNLEADRTEEFGALTLRHYRQSPASIVFDFTAQWRRGLASGAAAGRAQMSLEEVGFAPHRCIKIIPKPGKTVTLRFDAVPLGRQIVGYVGLADVFTRRDIRSPGKLSVAVDGHVQAGVLAGVDDGWVRFEVETQPGTGTVEFILEAVGAKARDRRICFAAEARE